jgi:aryl-alcohol dehydrogenase-like predicted oxidoreductase
MDKRKIGSLEVSVVGLGGNTFGSEFGTPVDAHGCQAIVNAALEVGITFFDTADIYGESEVLLGRALRHHRDEVVLATKVGARGMSSTPKQGTDLQASTLQDPRTGASRRAIELGVEDSLRRLGTDRIDLYQLHFPDPNVSCEESLAALDGLVRSGKVLEIGCSNFSAEQVHDAASVADTNGFRRYSSLQGEFSILRPRPIQSEIPACQELGMSFIPYSPLANGLLTGKYRRDEHLPPGTRLEHFDPSQVERILSERTFNRLERLGDFAAAQGHTIGELAIAWLIAHPTVATVIAGATNPDQVRANSKGADWLLLPDEVDRVNGLAASS